MKEKIDTTILTERILDMCQKQKISVNKMLQNSNSDKSVVDNLKKGSAPSVYAVMKIAEYFNISVDYLLGRTDNPNAVGDTYINSNNNSVNQAINGNVNVGVSSSEQDDKLLFEMIKSLDLVERSKIITQIDEMKNKK